MTAGPPILSATGLGLRYSPAWSLDVPSFDVHRGELLAVIGPNGSGKSTLLRLLALLETPERGEIAFGGRPVRADAALAVRRRMSVVFQDPLLADTTVAENVALGLRFRRRPRADADAAVARWLGRFGIEPLARRRARSLSAGEARRVALARALAPDPEVLLLDEPFTALDVPSREGLVTELAAVLRADGVTTVFVTHDRGEAQALADRVAVLMSGRLRQLDDTARVFQAPASEDVARFVGVETIVEGEVTARQGDIAMIAIGGTLVEVAAAVAPGARVRVAIRPEDVTLLPAGTPVPPSSARNALAGTVTRLTPSLLGTTVEIDCGFPLVARVTARSVSDLALRPGRAVVTVFKASAPHVFEQAARATW